MPEKMFPPETLRDYILKNSQSVPGYLHSGSMAVIWSLIEAQDELAVTGDVAEIGVYRGKLSILLSMALNAAERSFAFDTFSHPEGKLDENEAAYIANMEKFGVGSTTRQVYRTDTNTLDEGDLLRAIGGVSVRLFSIDGDHSRRAVAHDLSLATAVKKDDGVIIADDLFNTWYPEVTEGIIDYFQGQVNRWEPICIATANGPMSQGASKLFVAHESHANAYKRFLRVLNRDNFAMTTRFLGYPVLVFDFPEKVVKAPLDKENLGYIKKMTI